jgi:hypothetical protein
MRYLDGAVTDDYQPLGGECFDDIVDLGLISHQPPQRPAPVGIHRLLRGDSRDCRAAATAVASWIHDRRQAGAHARGAGYGGDG